MTDPRTLAQREGLVAAVEKLRHIGHAENCWNQTCQRCKAEVALASFDQPSFYAHGQAALQRERETK